MAKAEQKVPEEICIERAIAAQFEKLKLELSKQISDALNQGFKGQASNYPNARVPPRNPPVPAVGTNNNIAGGTVPGQRALDGGPNVNCWNCQRWGHTYRDCPAEKTVFCYNCGLPGVYSTACPRCHTQEMGNNQVPPHQGSAVIPSQ